LKTKYHSMKVEHSVFCDIHKLRALWMTETDCPISMSNVIEELIRNLKSTERSKDELRLCDKKLDKLLQGEEH